MISIDDAISLVKKNGQPLLKQAIKPVEKAGGYILSQDIYSPINMPPFRQSAMDGYAVNLHHNLNYVLIGEVKAGDGHQPILESGQAIRIFTGAAVPDSANAVIMQEKVKVIEGEIVIDDTVLPKINIRPAGEQVKAGDLALSKGTKLTPAAIGYLLSLGITTVNVYKKPQIGIVTTGNELIEPGEELAYGKIYESNSKMLLSALYNLKFYDITLYKVEDNYEKTLETLGTSIYNNDLTLITGGISVGDYDYVGKALAELNVQELFYKVMQKPGKPLFYGKKGESHVFALPGNPAAALSCFYVYVFITLQCFTNKETMELPKLKAISKSKFEKKGDRPQFLKGIYKNGEVEILEGQNSSMLQTFALANALVFLPQEVMKVDQGDTVEAILLPEI